MKTNKMFPPDGGAPVTVHPAKIDEMLGKGWTQEEIPDPKPAKKADPEPAPKKAAKKAKRGDD